MAQVNCNGKHGLFLHEQLAHLRTENTQTSLIINDLYCFFYINFSDIYIFQFSEM